MLFGVCAVVGILPFAIYRFLVGHFLVGVIDTILVVVIAGAGFYALQTGDTRYPGMLLVIVTTSAATLMAILHSAGLSWMYVALVASFFLVDRVTASLATLLALAILVIHGGAFHSPLQMSSFLITALLVSLFSFIFAYRSEMQRRQLVALASQDPLTGLQNRRAMEQELQIAIETRRRQKTPCGLVMIDIDHFKDINDAGGHETGDQVLMAFARMLRRSTRQVDRIFRFGGEEFVLLMPGADVAALGRITEKLRCAASALSELAPAAVTISLGGAALEEGEDWQRWLARADAALYRAKERGRDCAVIDAPSDPERHEAVRPT